MSIIKHISLSKNIYNKNLIVNIKRSFPSNYNETDQYILEKYELDLNNEQIRIELKNAVKTQTVFQYMMNEMFMSNSFNLVPTLFTGGSNDRNLLERYANFSQTPIFIDITENIKAQNNFYLDNLSFKNTYLYLYRIVYRYNDVVYNTNYTAGFENIDSGNLRDGKYKRFITKETLEKLFGSSWENIKHFFSTKANEDRYQYRQSPTVFKLPMRKVNHRKQGPLEDYKLKLNYVETSRKISDIEKINYKVKNEYLEKVEIFKKINKDNLDFKKSYGVLLNEFIEDISTITEGNFFSISQKNQYIYRILSKSLVGKFQYNIPDFMTNEGIYILLSGTIYGETIYNYLTNIVIEEVYGIIDDIYIANVEEKQILYTIKSGV